MTEDYQSYLIQEVVTKEHIVTYRLLSRALKVSVDVAKHMLYEFHRTQNADEPESIHATFHLTGRKRQTGHVNGTNGASEVMDMETEEEEEEDHIPQTSVMIIGEEELEAIKEEFEAITSIHIYSLEKGPIENLALLAGCNQIIGRDFANDNPLDRWKTYGSIHNPYIQRRTAKFAQKPPPAAAKANANPSVKPTPKPTARPNAASIFGSQASKASGAKGGDAKGNVSGPSAPTSSLKKSDSKSNLKKEKPHMFASFLKATPKTTEPNQSKESTPAPAEDEPMQGMSEDEGEDEEEIKIDQEKQAAARKIRAEREEKLRKMMDDDEDMPDAPLEEKASQDIEANEVAMEDPITTEASTLVEGGRRRGRRKVMKKKRQKDADGYLVTKEEAVWESFSEDEVVAPKPNPAPKPTTNTAKGKKATKGQGNIASFFKKA